jgi:hypothetical protein
MVVRSFVGGVINHIPLSSYVVPTRVTEFLKSDQVQPEDVLELSSDTESNSEFLIESSPKKKIHSKLIQNRFKETTTISTLYEVDDDVISLQPQEGEPIDSNDIRVKQYLNDQSKKFDSLINQNLDLVLKQQKYPNSPPKSSDGFIRSFIGNSTTRILNRFAYSYYPSTSNYTTEDPIPADRLLDNDVKMDIFIDSLDTSIKIKLLEELKQDLVRRELIDSTEYNVKSPGNQIFIDKVQDILIISIKFMVVCLKLSIPIWRLFYMKFMDNSLFFFNERNLAKAFDFILKLMRIMDNHLHRNDELINNYYNATTSEEPDLEVLYKELSLETHQFISKQVFDNNTPPGSQTWKQSALEFLAYKYLRSTNDLETLEKCHMNDPKYSMYFDKSSNNSCSSSPISMKQSSDDLTFFNATEQFANEL